MNRVEIILISPQQGKLDIDKNTEVPFTFSVSDIRDITQKKGTFSKTIKLAGTKNNNILLNNYFDVNIEAGTFNVNTLQKVQVMQNGVPILEDGYMQLLSINKVQNIINTEAYVEYDVVIKDNISDLFTKINGLELTDLEFGYLNTGFTSENIIATFNNTWEDEYKYFVPYKESNFYYLKDFKPAFFVKTIFDKIFENAGFEYQWDTFSASTVQFDKLLLPYVGEQLKAEPDYINSIQVIAEASGITNTYSGETLQLINGLTELQDLTNAYNPSTGIYTNQYYIDYNNGQNITWTYEVDYELSIKNTGAGTAVLTGATVQDDNPFVTTYIDYIPTIWLKAVGPYGALPNAQLGSYRIEEGTTIAAGAEVFLGATTSIVSLTAGLSAPTGQWYQEIATRKQGGPGIENGVWEIGGSSTGAVIPILRVTRIRMVARPNLEYIGYNSIMPFDKCLPVKVKQSDFVKSILTMYNLYIIKDEFQPNKLIFKHRDQYYDEGIQVDWTHKLAKDKEQTITLLPNLTNKKLILTYKQDDNDILMKGYRDNVGEIYGQVEYTFLNEYVKDTETKELIFSPMVIMRNTYGNHLPFYDGAAPKYNMKIALNAKQYEATTPYTIFDFSASTSGDFGEPVFSTGTTIPLVGHLNDGENPDFDINFGVNDYYYYDINNYTNNNLFNLHWARTINQIDNGKMLTAYFRLTETDINQLKLNQKIWVNNAWWVINQIIDYKAGVRELTKVELLSVDDSLKFATVADRTPNVINNGDTAAIQSIQTFIKNQQANSNMVVGVQPVTINGFNNFVTNSDNATVNGNNNQVVSALNSYVLGDNNQVQTNNAFVFGQNNVVNEDANNVTIFGSGISADTTDTVYVSNLVIPNGGTINGLPFSAITSGSTSTGVWVAGSSGTASIKADNTTGTDATGNYAVAEGQNTTASGIAAHAEGRETDATGDNSHAEGFQTLASGERSHAEGVQTTASNTGAHAEGVLTIASASGAHAEGNVTTASGLQAHAEGFQSTASGNYSHAEGNQTSAIGISSHSQGELSVANGVTSHAEGYASVANGLSSHAGGFGSVTQVDGEFAMASYPTVGFLHQFGTIHGQQSSTSTGPYYLQFSLDTSILNGYIIPTNTSMSFTYQIVARNPNTNDSRILTGQGLVKNVAGTNTLVYGAQLTTAGDASLAAIASVPIINVGAPTIQLTGILATDINWSGRIDYVIVGE